MIHCTTARCHHQQRSCEREDQLNLKLMASAIIYDTKSSLGEHLDKDSVRSWCQSCSEGGKYDFTVE
jgi:hypothetical protein